MTKSPHHNSEKKPLLSIIVPAFNEAKNLPLLLAELTKVCTPLPMGYEVLIVNDGSTDDTLRVAEALKEKYQGHVEVINFSRNFGKEAATTAGYRLAHGDAVMAVDADLQHHPHSSHSL